MASFQDIREDGAGNAFFNINDASGVGITSTLVSGKQALDVNVANSITVSVGVADKTTYTYGTTSFLPVGGVFQDTSPTLTAGQSGSFRLTANRAVHTNLRNASGVEIGVSGSALIVDGSAVTQPISAASLPLPSNAAQETGGHLASIDAKFSPATSPMTAVAQSATSVLLLASSASRKSFVIENNSLSMCFIAFGSTAVAASGGYTRRLQPNSAYEPQFGSYTGDISAIWAASGGGYAEITALS